MEYILSERDLVMKSLVVFGLMAFIASCGDSTQARKDVSVNKAGQSSCNVDGTTCTTCDATQCTTCNAAGTSCVRCDTAGANCEPVPPVYTANPSQSGPFGAYPSSYTFLDTPDANLCADAFLRKGITLSDLTVARSVNSFNVRNNGIAWQDMGASTVPVLNILHLESDFSNVTFQFLNPVGFYCIVKNNARFSNVTIQRKCSAQIAEIEPMTTVTVNQPPVKHGFFDFLCWGGRSNGGELSGTTTSFNSSIQEAPCIP